MAAAALTVGGTWMIVTSSLLLENAAYPLATAALMCTIAAIGAPGSRAGWWAIGFAVLAAAARLQLAALGAAHHPRAAARRRSCRAPRALAASAHGRLLAVSGAMSIAGLLATLVWRNGALGAYGGLATVPSASPAR